MTPAPFPLRSFLRVFGQDEHCMKSFLSDEQYRTTKRLPKDRT